MPLVLEISGLSKSFQDGETVIDVFKDIDFELAAGQALAVTGPSGSGKSTLLNILAGLIEADAGQIKANLAGNTYNLLLMTPRQLTQIRRRHIGYVHQFFNLIPTLTVLENVRLPGRLNKQRHLDERALELLEIFGLTHRLNYFPEKLSGGEQQRVAVARALLLAPPLILADEPTGNLDAENAQQVATLLFKYARELNSSVIIATHSQAVAARADHHLYLDTQR